MREWKEVDRKWQNGLLEVIEWTGKVIINIWEPWPSLSYSLDGAIKEENNRGRGYRGVHG